MKKWIATILAAAMVLSLCACGGNAESAQSTASVSTGEAMISVAEPEESETSVSTMEEVSAEEPEKPEEVEEASDEEPEDSASDVEENASANIAVVIKSDGEVEELTIEELVQVHDDNEIKFQNNYDNAQVILTGIVSEIETNDMVVVGDTSYSPKVSIHLEGGWVIGVPSTNEVAAELSKGDTIQAIGTITGFTKYGNEVAVLNTSGHPTEIALCSEDEDDEDADLRLINLFFAMIEDNDYKDATTFIQYYLDAYPNDTETVEQINQLLEEMKNVSYVGTYIKTYDHAFASTVTSVTELSVEQYGTGYDYVDSNMASDVQTYATYLMNCGYTKADNYVLIEVNGDSSAYLQFTNEDGNIIAMAQGDNFVRVIVYSVEGMVGNMIESATN